VKAPLARQLTFIRRDPNLIDSQARGFLEVLD
jgi:hypothetical protein